jgi:hypothetical protein
MERIGKEAVVSQFKILVRNLLGRHKSTNLRIGCVLAEIYTGRLSGTYRTQFRRANFLSYKVTHGNSEDIV